MSKAKSLWDILQKFKDAEDDGSKVQVGAIMDEVEYRSFGPFLTIAGVITLAPIIGDIPGVPILVGTSVNLVTVQILLKRKHIWLPSWILSRSLDRKKLLKAINWLEPKVKVVDKIFQPRLTFFTRGPAKYVVAFFCILVGASTPFLEVIPFSANLAGAAFLAFGLALIAEDGLLAIIALVFTGGVGYLIGSQLLF